MEEEASIDKEHTNESNVTEEASPYQNEEDSSKRSRGDTQNESSTANDLKHMSSIHE